MVTARDAVFQPLPARTNFVAPIWQARVRVAENAPDSRRFHATSRVGACSAALVSLALAACGGGGGGGGTSTPVTGTTQYTIGGTTSGLTGTGLVLQDNGGDDLAVSGNGPFTFATKVNAGATYSVTVKTQPSGQTCTVTGGSGTASANVTSVAVACAATGGGGPTTVTIGGTVSGLTASGLVLQDNGGDNLSVSQNGAFTFATAVAVGANYAVTVATQPTGQTCTVTSGSGTAPSSNVTNVAVTCAGATASTGKFAFVANNRSNNIMAFSIDPNTGGLTPQGNAVPVGASPAAVSLAPNGKWAFTATDNGTKIYAFTVDQTTGALTAVLGSPFTNAAFTAQGHPYPDIAVDPQSHFLYLASYYDGVVAGFTIDQNTGALASVGPGVAAGAGAGGIPAFSPDGKFLYVVNQGATNPFGGNVVGTTNNANTVSAFSINQTTGQLTLVGTVATGNTADTNHGAQPSWIAFTPNGKFAYVSNTGQSSVTAFAVGADGSLTAPTNVPSTGHPQDLTIDSTGTHLYAPNTTQDAQGNPAGNVTVFSIDGTSGALTALGQVPAGLQPIFLQIEASGKYAYVSSNGGSEVYGYSIGSNGMLSALSTPTFATQPNPNFVNIDPSGKFLYTANRNGGGAGTISAFKIDPATGLLSSISGANGIPTNGNSPFFVSISPEAPGIRD